MHILKEIKDLPMTLISIDDSFNFIIARENATNCAVKWYPEKLEGIYFIQGETTLTDLLDIDDKEFNLMNDEDIEYYYGNTLIELME